MLVTLRRKLSVQIFYLRFLFLITILDHRKAASTRLQRSNNLLGFYSTIDCLQLTLVRKLFIAKMFQDYEISSGVMHKLLLGDPLPSDPMIVQLSYADETYRISDSSNLWMPVTITGEAKEMLGKPSETTIYKILLRGYVTSEANAHAASQC
jgi:hypothetical protein